MPNTLYSILGLDDTASLEDITQAYQVRKQKLEHDMDPDSQNELKLAQQAHSVLSNPTQRRKYDQSLKERIARNNAVIYHSDETRHGSGGTLIKFLVLSALAFSGYLAYHHYIHEQAQANAHTGSSQTIPLDAADSNNSHEPVQLSSPAQQPPAESPPPQQALTQQQASTPDISDIDAVPIPAPATQRRAYVSFLSQPSPRAFIICSDSRVMTFAGSKAFVQTKLSSLPDGCKPYAVDSRVVWNRIDTASTCGAGGNCTQSGQNPSALDSTPDTTSTAAPSIPASGTAPLVLGQGRSGHYFVDGTVNGHYLNFVVDTGASYVTLPLDFALAAGLHCNGLATLQTGNGVSRACHVVIQSLTFGNYELQYVDALVAPNLNQPLLGMNVLRRFHIEQNGGQMRLTKNY